MSSAAPASTKVSTSPSFWQVMPTAPAAICISAIAGILCVLMCGRLAIPWRSSSAWARRMFASSLSRSMVTAGVSRSSTGAPRKALGVAIETSEAPARMVGNPLGNVADARRSIGKIRSRRVVGKPGSLQTILLSDNRSRTLSSRCDARYADNMTNLDTFALRGRSARKRNLFTHVVEELGSRIIRGQFRPYGALPNESVLSQEFGASRSVIREAVKSLAAKGLIESRTRTGIRVLPPIHWNLLDPEVLDWRYSAMRPADFFREIFEVRGMIEPQAAELAAARATDADIAEIQAAYRAMERAEEPGSTAISADLRFHRAILAAAHNELLLQMGSLIGVGLLVSYRLSSESFSVFLPLHKNVADAIAARRPAKARAAMARLVGDTRSFLDERLKPPAARRRATGKASRQVTSVS